MNIQGIYFLLKNKKKGHCVLSSQLLYSFATASFVWSNLHFRTREPLPEATVHNFQIILHNSLKIMVEYRTE